MKLSRVFFTSLVVFIGFSLTGCFTPTSIPLEILSISPEVDATEVLIDAIITVETSAELDATSVTVESV